MKSKMIIITSALMLTLTACASSQQVETTTITPITAVPATEATVISTMTAELTEPHTEKVTEKVTEKETELPNAVKITSLEHGDLEDVIEVEGENAITIKAKISPSYNNKATIDQNYFNVADIICNQGCENYSRIDYWAVADMSGGGEAKVISFSLESDTIQKIYNKQIAETQIGDYASELWLHQSLTE